MSKPEWTKIGSVEVCVGTDGVTGVWNGTYVSAIHPRSTTSYWIATKERFESKHCQPPAPRHIREDFADGSVVIKSVDKDEQGRPLRCAMISRQIYGRAWVEKGDSRGIGQAASEAISEAIRYVETWE